MSQAEVTINGRVIGPAHPPYVVAEISANHTQDYEKAARLVRLAKEAGADAVKLQTYTPDTLTIDCDSPLFCIGAGSPWAGRTLYDLYQEAYTPWEWHRPLKQAADEVGLTFFSSPFDGTAVDFLEELGVPAYKVASFENTDVVLLERIAATRKPVIVSTGMATLSEIAETVELLRRTGCDEMVLLKCVSAYPAPPESMNLRAIPHLAETFGVVVGLSDHTLGTEVAVAAVGLGASLIEKHFIEQRADGGPDAAFSMEPEEFSRLVRQARTAWSALGHVNYGPTKAEEGSLVFRRSLFVVQDVRPGEKFTLENVRSIRPGYGLPTKFLESILGQRAARSVKRGTPVTWDLLTPEA